MYVLILINNSASNLVLTHGGPCTRLFFLRSRCYYTNPYTSVTAQTATSKGRSQAWMATAHSEFAFTNSPEGLLHSTTSSDVQSTKLVFIIVIRLSDLRYGFVRRDILTTFAYDDGTYSMLGRPTTALHEIAMVKTTENLDRHPLVPRHGGSPPVPGAK